MYPEEVDSKQPHYFWPSTKPHGRCEVCGHLAEHPIHPRWTQEKLDEARAKGKQMSLRLQELADK